MGITKNEFEYQVMSIIGLFSFSDYQEADTRNQIYIFSIKWFATKEKHSIETLKDIKLVITEKYEFEYRDRPISIAQYGLLGSLNLLAQASVIAVLINSQFVHS